MLNVDTIKNGLVIDHIKAGCGPQIFHWLGLDKANFTSALIMNVPSKKAERKDIIKIDQLMELDLDVLGYIDSNITVNFVQDGKLVDKKHLELPEKLDDVIKCKNPRCITSVEQEIVHSFRLTDKENKIYRCAYCDAEHKVK